MTSIQELLAAKKDIERQLASARKEARAKKPDAESLAKVRELMKQLGVSVTDLKKNTNLPPKYVDPVTGKTWSGRGRRPAWMDSIKRAEAAQLAAA